jgi:hypothetical protein
MKSFEFARTGVADRNGLSSHVQRNSRRRQTGATEALGLTVHFHHNSGSFRHRGHLPRDESRSAGGAAIRMSLAP